MIVVDAGAWATALVDDGPLGDAARQVLVADPLWAGPGHLPIEVLRTVRRYESAGLITPEWADVCVAEVADAEVRYAPPSRWLLSEVWRLRHNLTAYDAAYVVLAQYHGLCARHARRAAGAGGSSGGRGRTCSRDLRPALPGGHG